MFCAAYIFEKEGAALNSFLGYLLLYVMHPFL